MDNKHERAAQTNISIIFSVERSWRSEVVRSPVFSSCCLANPRGALAYAPLQLSPESKASDLLMLLESKVSELSTFLVSEASLYLVMLKLEASDLLMFLKSKAS